jgi:hypothetical protein
VLTHTAYGYSYCLHLLEPILEMGREGLVLKLIVIVG